MKSQTLRHQGSGSAPTQSLPDSWWFNRPDGGSGACAPRADFTGDAAQIPLDGQWGFQVFATVQEALDFCAWPQPLPELGDVVRVPAHWGVEKISDPHLPGRPAYTNITYPFVLTPPEAPEQNPTAWYSTTFDADQVCGQQTQRVLLRFEGVESAYRVWLNGHWVGQAMGSRLTHEFDITSAVRAGANNIAVLVHQFSAGSYLEDQDQWWLPGIFRPVTVIAERGGEIQDLHIQARWDSAREQGQLTVEVTGGPETFPVLVTAQPSDDARRPTDAQSMRINGSEPTTMIVENAGPWSPEDPLLWTLQMESNTGCKATLEVGFTDIRIDDDGLLRANGDPVRFRGVNRHEFHPRRGRAVTVQDTRDDYNTMLQHHINAVRTSHYPPASHALSLADRMGLWVVLEGDLETHGFVRQNWRDNPSDDPRWRQAIVERTARMWHRDKNHPSLIMLSLGNESHTGANLKAAARWLRARTHLPIHYEGDFRAEYADVHSRMYATPSEWRKLAAGQPHPAFPAATAATVGRQPLVLCEYAHAMGNGPGGLQEYEQIFRQYPRACGGFVWEFKDQGLFAVSPSGRHRVAYGGDFAETVHDANFVLDGLCFADGSASPGMTEYAAVIDPLWVDLVDEAGVRRLVVGNGYDHSQLTDVVVEVVHTGAEGAHGPYVRHITDLGPKALAVVEAPEPGHEDSVQVVVEATVVCGHRSQRRARKRVWSGPMPHRPEAQGQPCDVPPILAGLTATAWRAPTDNDNGFFEPARERYGQDPAVDWHEWGGTSAEDRDPLHGPGVVIPTAHRWREDGLHSSAPDVAMRAWSQPDRWTQVEITLSLESASDPGRLGVVVPVPLDVHHVLTWVGHGPGEGAPDARVSATFGRWSQHPVNLFTRYPVPQSTGTRGDLRSLSMALANQGPEIATSLELEVVELQLDGVSQPEGLWWSLLPYSDAQLEATTHDDELPQPASLQPWLLHLDAAYSGLGSRSCGVDVQAQHRVQARNATITIRTRTVARASS